VLHEALLRALRSYDHLRDSSRFRPWLFQIITRTFQSAARRAYWKRFIPITSADAVDRIPAVFSRPEWNTERLQLWDTLGCLSARERAAVLLFEIGGFHLDEIAAIQGGLSVGVRQ
jgi:RNA polymerase sigma factor (sigma-70 family)